MKSVDVVLDGQSLVTPRSIAAEFLSTKNTLLNDRDRLMAESELAIILNLAYQQI